MGSRFKEIAEHCRYLSVRPDGKYKAMCDYYGELDEVHVVVVARNDSFRDGVYLLNKEIRLNDQLRNDKAIDDLINKLKEFCDA